VTQLEDMEDIMREMLYRLEARTKIAADPRPSLKKQNISIYKWYMDYQLTQVDNYLAYLNKGLKSLPENQPIVLHQYSLDPKQKPLHMNFSNHFLTTKVASANLHADGADHSHRYQKLLYEMQG
jgi:hypothetical protein